MNNKSIHAGLGMVKVGSSGQTSHINVAGYFLIIRDLEWVESYLFFFGFIHVLGYCYLPSKDMFYPFP